MSHGVLPLRRLGRAAALVTAIGTVGGCTEPAAPEPQPAPVAEAAPVAAAEPTGLLVASERAFDLPVPAGVSRLDVDDGVEHFRLDEASFDDIIEFFEAHLAGGARVTHFERGARIEPAEGPARAIYVYREQVGRAWVVSYFDVDAAAAARSVQTPESDAPAAGVAGAAGGTAAGSPGFADEAAAVGGGGQVASPAVAPSDARWLEEQMGVQTAEGRAAPAPIGVRTFSVGIPAVERARSYRPPIRFIRGVQEPRRNPDALF